MGKKRSSGTEICTECGKPYTTLNQTIKRTIKRFGRYVCPDCAKELSKDKFKQTCLERYGVDNPMKISEVKEKHTSPFADQKIQKKIKQKYKETTGYENPGQNPKVKEKMKSTCLEKYGVEYALSAPQVREKILDTMTKNGNVPTSKPQIECYNILKDLGYDVILNYNEGPLSLDVLIQINDIKIDFEYDGWYWHQDKRKDCARNAVVRDLGYKIFRVKAFSDITPSVDQLQEGINKLLQTDETIYYIEIK